VGRNIRSIFGENINIGRRELVINRNGKHLLPLATVLSFSIPFTANATNGMNLEGYGPVLF